MPIQQHTMHRGMCFGPEIAREASPSARNKEAHSNTENGTVSRGRRGAQRAAKLDFARPADVLKLASSGQIPDRKLAKGLYEVSSTARAL